MSYRPFIPQPLPLSISLALLSSLAPASASAEIPAPESWQQCAATTSNNDRLACFDAWALKQNPQTPPPATTWAAPMASTQEPAAQAPASNAAPVIALTETGLPLTPTNGGCRDPRYSEMSRYFELEPGSDCGTFNFRGYRPMSVSVAIGDEVNQQPYSSSRGLATEQPYQKHEMRLQLSARTKIASGLLTGPTSSGKDSLWFGYTQQSYWQLFSPGLSRPFRSTDHEPEVIYVYPSTLALPWDWKLRYTGVGLVHQSNGQSLPLSRSWNRVYLMAGFEKSDQWRVQARVWQRLHESNGSDDNPGISDYVGRGELTAGWNLDKDNTLGLTVRHALRKDGRGSVRLEWLKSLAGDGDRKNALRLHTQLFSGYGDSLVDYNVRRTVLSVGLSLVDF